MKRMAAPDSMNEPVLFTKLYIPRSTSETVVRPRLSSRLRHGLGVKLTIVHAPAGFGKSTLLAEWADSLETKPAWLSLDQADDDMHGFWRYVAAAVDSVEPGFRERVKPGIDMLAPDHYQSGMSILLNELAGLDRPLVLILDDFHYIRNTDLVASFAHLISYLPAHVHIFAASRLEPPFPAARLISANQMLMLDAADLRFDLEESAAFCRDCMGIDIRPEENEELLRRTEGWITAMKLALMAMPKYEDASAMLRQFSGDSRTMERYLLEEVFAQQQAEVQSFLMKSAFLKRMNASLCTAVTGVKRSQEMLEHLERVQLFLIPLDEKRGWFRYHHLFSEFLSDRLRKFESAGVPLLLLEAGRWCRREGYLEEALEYLLMGKHYEPAIQVLEEMTQSMVRMDWSGLFSRMSDIPAPYLLDHPSLYFSYAMTLLFGNRQYGKVQQMLQDAEEGFSVKSKGWSEEEKADFLALLYFVRAFYAAEALHDMAKVVEYMQMSRHYKPSGVKLVFASHDQTGSPSLSRNHPWTGTGSMNRAVLAAFLENLIAAVDELGLAGATRVSLAEALYEWNDLDEAESYAMKAITDAEPGNPQISEYLMPALLLVGKIRKARGQRAEAATWLGKARQTLMNYGLPSALFYVELELANLALEQGDSEPAEAWLARYGVSLHAEPALERIYEVQFCVRVLLASERMQEAWELTEKLLAVSEPAGYTYYSIGTFILQVQILLRQDKKEQALALLGRTLHLTEPEGFVRTYADEGSSLIELLVRLLRTLKTQGGGKDKPTAGYVQQVLDVIRSEGGGAELSPASAARVQTGLTDREEAVFRLLIQGMTNKEIAEQLYISPGTVKTHLIHIYGKLGVNNRVMAVNRGIELGYS